MNFIQDINSQINLTVANNVNLQQLDSVIRITVHNFLFKIEHRILVLKDDAIKAATVCLDMYKQLMVSTNGDNNGSGGESYNSDGGDNNNNEEGNSDSDNDDNDNKGDNNNMIEIEVRMVILIVITKL